MKTITQTCRCGATATFSDDRDTTLNTSGIPDGHGRMYHVERMAAEWRELHLKCHTPVGPKS